MALLLRQLNPSSPFLAHLPVQHSNTTRYYYLVDYYMSDITTIIHVYCSCLLGLKSMAALFRWPCTPPLSSLMGALHGFPPLLTVGTRLSAVLLALISYTTTNCKH